MTCVIPEVAPQTKFENPRLDLLPPIKKNYRYRSFIHIKLESSIKLQQKIIFPCLISGLTLNGIDFEPPNSCQLQVTKLGYSINETELQWVENKLYRNALH